MPPFEGQTADETISLLRQGLDVAIRERAQFAIESCRLGIQLDWCREAASGLERIVFGQVGHNLTGDCPSDRDDPRRDPSCEACRLIGRWGAIKPTNQEAGR